VVNDQTGSPTYAPDLATALFELARRTVSGIFHVTNSGQCTWYEFAGELIRLAGLDVPITPVTTEEFPRPARRPAFSVLSNRRYVETVGQPLRHWLEAAGEYMGRMKEEG
jgi:dTDP-4-dehydrorhamnose reductase